MKKIFLLGFSFFLMLSTSCKQPYSTDSFDKNTMKGSWEFVSATDCKTYGNIVVRNIGTSSLYTYENSWPNPNPWTNNIYTEVFAIKIEDNDLLNIIFDASPKYLKEEKTIELLECSSSIGGTMKFRNITDNITYTYIRVAN